LAIQGFMIDQRDRVMAEPCSVVAVIIVWNGE
jgi:hypothetical protein